MTNNKLTKVDTQETILSNTSILIPARNEATSLKTLLPALKNACPNAEIIVINDGSTDNTMQVVTEHDIPLITHPYNMGNGAAIKSGARAASKKYLITMDADGQHDPGNIPSLLAKMHEGYEMVVGARTYESQASKRRWLGNQLYNRLASLMVEKKIEDLTSGFRAVNAKIFKRYLYLLPNGFSYPTTITMAFFRNGFPVAYVPIKAHKRVGKSHLRLFKDGIRFLVIIFKIGALYSPLKIFFPTSVMLFLAGVINYTYTYMISDQFTNMSALLFIISIIIFMIGLLAEQITILIYKDSHH